jgi:hypothetical protein
MNEWMNEWMNKRQPLSERSYKGLSRTPPEVKDSIKRAEYNAMQYDTIDQQAPDRMATSCNKHRQKQTAVDPVLKRGLRRKVFSEKHTACATRANNVQHVLA